MKPYPLFLLKREGKINKIRDYLGRYHMATIAGEFPLVGNKMYPYKF